MRKTTTYRIITLSFISVIFLSGIMSVMQNTLAYEGDTEIKSIDVSIDTYIITANPDRIRIGITIETEYELENISLYLKSTQPDGQWSRDEWELESFDDYLKPEEFDENGYYCDPFNAFTYGSTEQNIQAKFVVWYYNADGDLVSKDFIIDPIDIDEPKPVTNTNILFLVHGFSGSPDDWDEYTGDDDYKDFYTSSRIEAVDLYADGRDWNTPIQDLAVFLYEEIIDANVDEIDIIGYSMGGIVARFMIKEMYSSSYTRDGTTYDPIDEQTAHNDKKMKINHYFSIASPHDGTMISYVTPKQGEQLSQDSDFLNDLNSGDDTPYDANHHTDGIEWTTIAGDKVYDLYEWVGPGVLDFDWVRHHLHDDGVVTEDSALLGGSNTNNWVYQDLALNLHYIMLEINDIRHDILDLIDDVHHKNTVYTFTKDASEFSDSDPGSVLVEIEDKNDLYSVSVLLDGNMVFQEGSISGAGENYRSFSVDITNELGSHTITATALDDIGDTSSQSYSLSIYDDDDTEPIIEWEFIRETKEGQYIPDPDPNDDEIDTYDGQDEDGSDDADKWAGYIKITATDPESNINPSAEADEIETNLDGDVISETRYHYIREEILANGLTDGKLSYSISETFWNDDQDRWEGEENIDDESSTIDLTIHITDDDTEAPVVIIEYPAFGSDSLLGMYTGYDCDPNELIFTVSDGSGLYYNEGDPADEWNTYSEYRFPIDGYLYGNDYTDTVCEFNIRDNDNDWGSGYDDTTDNFISETVRIGDDDITPPTLTIEYKDVNPYGAGEVDGFGTDGKPGYIRWQIHDYDFYPEQKNIFGHAYDPVTSGIDDYSVMVNEYPLSWFAEGMTEEERIQEIETSQLEPESVYYVESGEDLKGVDSIQNIWHLPIAQAVLQIVMWARDYDVDRLGDDTHGYEVDYLENTATYYITLNDDDMWEPVISVGYVDEDNNPISGFMSTDGEPGYLIVFPEDPFPFGREGSDEYGIDFIRSWIETEYYVETIYYSDVVGYYKIHIPSTLGNNPVGIAHIYDNDNDVNWEGDSLYHSEELPAVTIVDDDTTAPIVDNVIITPQADGTLKLEIFSHDDASGNDNDRQISNMKIYVDDILVRELVNPPAGESTHTTIYIDRFSEYIFFGQHEISVEVTDGDNDRMEWMWLPEGYMLVDTDSLTTVAKGYMFENTLQDAIDYLQYLLGMYSNSQFTDFILTMPDAYLKAPAMDSKLEIIDLIQQLYAFIMQDDWEGYTSAEELLLSEIIPKMGGIILDPSKVFAYISAGDPDDIEDPDYPYTPYADPLIINENTQEEFRWEVMKLWMYCRVINMVYLPIEETGIATDTFDILDDTWFSTLPIPLPINPDSRTIVPEIDGHTNVMRIEDNSETAMTVLGRFCDGIVYYGTLEMWVRFPNMPYRTITNEGDFGMVIAVMNYDSDNPEATAFVGGVLYNRGILGIGQIGAGGNTEIFLPIIPEKWYHLQIDFELTDGEYMGLNTDEMRVTLNKYHSRVVSCSDAPNGINLLGLFTSDRASGFDIHINDVGMNWDGVYTIGQNIYAPWLDNTPPTISTVYTGDQTDGNPGTLTFSAWDESGVVGEESITYDLSAELGTYEYTFTAEDMYGNIATKTESVIIIDDDTTLDIADLTITSDMNDISITFMDNDYSGIGTIAIAVDGEEITGYTTTIDGNVWTLTIPNQWIFEMGLHDISITITDADNDRIGDASAMTYTDTFEITEQDIIDWLMNQLQELKAMVWACDSWRENGHGCGCGHSNNHYQNTMINKIDETISLIEAGDYREAKNKLMNDIYPKLVGETVCHGDWKNAWVTDEEDQLAFKEKIDDITDGLEILIGDDNQCHCHRRHYHHYHHSHHHWFRNHYRHHICKH